MIKSLRDDNLRHCEFVMLRGVGYSSHTSFPGLRMTKLIRFLSNLTAALFAGSLYAVDGQYQGDINGTPATLQVQSSGQQMQGEINASGYIYLLQGQSDGKMAEGQLQDQQTGATMSFSLQTSDNQAQLTLMSFGQPLVLQFNRVDDASALPGNQTQQSLPSPEGQLDPRLIGRWTSNDTMISGDASFVSNSHVTFAADGRYLYQDGSAFASGSSDWGSTTIESSPGAGGDAGNWRVEGDLIYTRPDATGQWQLLGRVYIEGNSALLYYPDGSKTLWKRN